MEKYRSSLGVTLAGGLTEVVTPWAGAALLVQLYRKVGIEAAVEKTLPRKKSAKGLSLSPSQFTNVVLITSLCRRWQKWQAPCFPVRLLQKPPFVEPVFQLVIVSGFYILVLE